MDRRTLSMLGVVGLMFAIGTAHAKSGGLSVSTTGGSTGTVVSGVITVANAGKSAAPITGVSDALEVRFPAGYPVPPLPPGSTSGYWVVTTAAVPAPSSVPALGTVSLPYGIDLCRVPRTPGAKDMRISVVVTAGTTTADARSANFPIPSPLACPVCGNGIREGTEQCDGGACCTSACTRAANGTACSDGDACTRTDTCQAGVCIGSNAVVCQATGPCVVAGACNAATGVCSSPPRMNGSTCDDGDPCSTGDRCTAGQCRGMPIVCDDGNACTSDACTGGSCIFTPNTKPCDDGDACTIGDVCAAGICGGGTPLDCNDHQTCTEDSCDPTTGCTHDATPSCDVCTADECLLCRQDCTATHTRCSDGCWTGFFGCLNGCTLTYCAPFCQVNLGACLDRCPSEAACGADCDGGNGCAAGCAQP